MNGSNIFSSNNSNGSSAVAASAAPTGFLGGLDMTSAIAIAVMASAFMRR